MVFPHKHFNMIIKKSLEDKIRFLCAKNPHNEYSGTLFYKTEGSFEQDNLCIIGVDLYLQDLGNAVYTELSQDISMASYMARHDLMGYYTGCMHSHHSMSTNFSGTDMETVNDWGNTQNHFVSLIVNNEGLYSAKITRKIKRTTKSTSSGTIEYAYKSWQDIEHSSVTKFESKTNSVTDYYIEVFNLDITVEKSDYRKSELEERLEELLNTKRKFESRSYPYIENVYGRNSDNIRIPFAKREDIIDTTPVQQGYTEDSSDYVLGFQNTDVSSYFQKKHEKLVSDFIKQIITFNMLSPMNSSLNMDTRSKNFNSICKKMFPNPNDFGEFIESFISVALDYVVKTEDFAVWASEMIEGFNREHPYKSSAAEIFLTKVTQEIAKLNITGDYITYYYSTLEYMV